MDKFTEAMVIACPSCNHETGFFNLVCDTCYGITNGLRPGRYQIFGVELTLTEYKIHKWTTQQQVRRVSQMSTRETASLIGSTGSLRIAPRIHTQIKILNVRKVFDRTDVLVTPVNGTGEEWVSMFRVSFSAAEILFQCKQEERIFEGLNP